MPRIVSSVLRVMKEEELEERKMAKITDLLGVMHMMSEVERIQDGSFLLDLQIVVVEKAQNHFLICTLS